MVGIESLVLVSPGDAVTDRVSYSRHFGVTHFETGTVSAVSGAFVYVTIAVCPAVFYYHGILLLEKVVAVI